MIMKKYMTLKYFYLFAGAMILQSSLFAQQKGEVKDQEFIIRKDRVLTLPKQPRRFERIPALPAAKSNSSFSYEVKPYSIYLSPVDIRPEAAQKQFPVNREELYRGFARLGYGNYSSPIVEGRYNIWEEGDYNLGANIRHEGFYTGPVEGRNSGENFTQVGVAGTIFKDQFQLSGGVDYDRHQFKFYGYDPVAFPNFLPMENTLNTFRLNAGIQNIEKMGGINYKAKVQARVFNDQFEAVENELALKGASDYWFDDHMSVALGLNLSLTRPKDEFYQDISRNYFRLNPSFGYQKNGLKAKIGANLVVENDQWEEKKSNIHIFPSIYAEYMLQDAFGVYASFEGDVHRKTYFDFVRENPFLGPSTSLLNTIQNYAVKAGVKGTVLEELTYEAGVSYGKFQHMHFFANSPLDSAKFNVFFDDDTRVLNYSLKLGWEYDGWYRLVGSVDYFQYTMGTLGFAFHRPEWQVQLNNNFTPGKKWLLQFNANLMGGIVAPVLYYDIMNSPVNLPAVLDLQVKADYQITERISAFVTGNNLLNRNNSRFLHYPVRGIQGIAGVTFKF